MKIFLKSLVVFQLLYLQLKGQNNNESGSYPEAFRGLINVGTSSPEAASLGKFGSIPVSYCTGIPNIGIPMYEINIGGIKLPINLDYHAGGIKVDETSSSVGLGWALNGVGMISRNVVGLPDEESSGLIGTPNEHDVFMAPAAYATYLYNIKNRLADAEPDIFQYTINGQSGKFIFRNDGTIMQIPVTNNKIVLDDQGVFTIIDENGIKYIFAETQRSSSSETTIPSYVSTWRITQIVAANNVDVITFTYESACNVTYEKVTCSAYNLGTDVNSFLFADPGGSGQSLCEPSTSSLDNEIPFFQTITHYESYPKTILWRGGQIDFANICDRSDATGSAERLDEVDVSSIQNGIKTQVKKIKLYQSYFFSNPMINESPSEKNYRLKLDSVAFLPINTTDQPAVYVLDYNTTIDMAPRESGAQDRWGFNNGKFSNGNFISIPKQTVLYNSTYHLIGSANRDADPNFMVACMIKSLKYPTGGKTVFEFESHQYKTGFSVTTPVNVYCNAYGGLQESTQQTFTPDENASGFSFSANFSAYINTTLSHVPTVTVTDQGTGEIITQVGSTTPSAVFNTGILSIPLVSGHTYVIKTEIYTTTASSVSATATISWIETTPAVEAIEQGGGLRVKSILNLNTNGDFINKDIYQYGDDNTGVALTPQYYQDINFEVVIHRYGCNSNDVEQPPCTYFAENQIPAAVPGYSLIYRSNSIFSTSQYAGSPVLYRKVTKMSVDAQGNPNGKTVYGYQVFQDGSATGSNPIPKMTAQQYQNTGIYLISNCWKNGFLTSVDTYKNNGDGYSLISNITNNYSVSMYGSMSILKVKPKYLHTGCEITSSLYVADDFILYEVPITTGSMLLSSYTSSNYTDDGQVLSKTITYQYNNQLQPTQQQTVNSKGETETELMTYPVDLASSSNVYQNMVNRNIIAPIIEKTNKNNGTIISQTKINYSDWLGNGNLLMPQSVEAKVLNAPFDTKILYDAYDQFGNVLQQRKAGDVQHSYLWGYQNTYPVADVIGATYNSIAGLVNLSVLNNPPSDQALRTELDKVRSGLLGQTTLVNTYTYYPLVGLATKTDPAGRTGYFEYDGLQRLKLIRDQNNNILKQYCYNYAGKPEACMINNVVTNPVPSTVYAALSYENVNTTDNYTSADIVVNFYSDINCTQPVSVSGLTVNFAEAGSCDNDGPDSYNVNSPIVNGTSYVLVTNGFIYYSGSWEDQAGVDHPDNCTINYTLVAGSGYIIKQLL